MNAYRERIDRLGVPLIYHIAEVAHQVRNLGAEVEAIAWLHDSVTDGRASFAEIEIRFGRVVHDGVVALTRRTGERYFAEYLPRVACNPCAVPVKLADAVDRLRFARCLALFDPPRASGLTRRHRHVLEMLGGVGTSAEPRARSAAR